VKQASVFPVLHSALLGIMLVALSTVSVNYWLANQYSLRASQKFVAEQESCEWDEVEEKAEKNLADSAIESTLSKNSLLFFLRQTALLQHLHVSSRYYPLYIGVIHTPPPQG
jgi:hypothetical protein